MSNSTPVSVIIEHLSDGSTIERFRGRVTKLYPMKTRGSGESAFTKQEGELTDDSGGKIPVEWRLDGSELAKDRQGKVVTIECVKTQHGLRGLTVMDDTYQDKTTRKLKITKTAALAWEDGAAGNTTTTTTQPSQGSQSSQPSQGSQPPKPGTVNSFPQREDGMRAGMCINNAVEILRGLGKPVEYFRSVEFSRDVYHIASRLHVVATYLEHSKLDKSALPPPKEKTPEQLKAEAEAAAKQKAEAEAAEKKRVADEAARAAAAKQQQAAFPPGLDEEDEIPF